MPKEIGNITRFEGGISDGSKVGITNSARFIRSLDFRSDPSQLELLKAPSLDSGTLVTGLVKWVRKAGSDVYFYDNDGKLYKKSSGTWSLEHTATQSQGNGLEYFSEDRYLYYAQNTGIGRYGRLDSSPVWTDDYLSTIGGAPTNTSVLILSRSSSQYAYVADTADHSLTGDMSIEAFINPASLPEDLEEYTIVSKWNENSNQRSYKFSLAASSASFGSGADGALTISNNTTETVIDANFSATSGANSFTISNVTGTFTAGQRVLLHQTRGSNVGNFEEREILSVVGTTVTLTESITNTYSHSATASVANKAQIRVLKQYTDVTINSGVTYTAKAWDGLKGGILAFLCNGTLTINGTISAKGKGFRPGPQPGTDLGYAGEGSAGYWTKTRNANGTGGGAGTWFSGASNPPSGGGGGGGHASSGQNGKQQFGYSTWGYGGNSIGNANQTTIHFGGAGGSGGRGADGAGLTDLGGYGGGIVFAVAATFTISSTGKITCNGTSSQGTWDSNQDGNGGGGAGGSFYGKCISGSLNTNKITLAGGQGGTGTVGEGGDGAVGRSTMYYATSVSGSASPTITTNEDSTLSASDGIELRFTISSTGSNEERYFADVTGLIQQDAWSRVAATYDASAATTKLYVSANEIVSMTRSLTSIYDSTAAFAIGADFDSSAQNFADMMVDDVRIWGDIRSESELQTYNTRVLLGTEAGLVGYFKLDGDYTDATSNGNDLAGSGSPTFGLSVPFSGVTTRKDEDQSNIATGQSYSIPTALSESATARQTFVPDKDPQKSISVNIGATGSGDWTIVVHDQQNNEVASKTVVNGDLSTGVFEFVFDSVWRPIRGATYHFHITSTLGSGTIVSGTTSDMEDAWFTSHYQFLIEDEYHPMIHFLTFLVIGNERYLAKLEPGDIYNPHRLVLPSGFRIRCLGFYDEYLAIGTTVGTDITSAPSGRIFFWDGTSDTYNFFIDVPEGAINAIKGSRGILYVHAGFRGDLLAYGGGPEAKKLKRLPKIGSGDTLEIYPSALEMWDTLIVTGTGASNSDTLERGVYTWGSLSESFPDAMGMDYQTSLGLQKTSDTEIGCLYPVGTDLYISWKNGSSYGVDILSIDSSVAQSGSYESLLADLGSLTREKLPLAVRIDFQPLEDGHSVTPKYKINREDTWRYGDAQTTEGSRYARTTIASGAYEIEIGFDVETTSGTSPVITGVSLESESEAGARRT